MSRRKTSSNFKIIGYAIIAIVLAVLIIKFISNEDSWICKNGRWEKHGNPSKPMPSETCQNNF